MTRVQHRTVTAIWLCWRAVTRTSADTSPEPRPAGVQWPGPAPALQPGPSRPAPRRPRSGSAQHRTVTGPPDSDYMPGRSAGAPTGDADADSDCRRPCSGSAQRRTVARIASTRAGSRAARLYLPAGPRASVGCHGSRQARGRLSAPTARSRGTRTAGSLELGQRSSPSFQTDCISAGARAVSAS